MENSININERFITRLNEFLRFYEVPNPAVVMGTLVFYKRKIDTDSTGLFFNPIIPEKPSAQAFKDAYIESLMSFLLTIFDESQIVHVLDSLRKVPVAAYMSFEAHFADFNFNEKHLTVDDFGRLFSQILQLTTKLKRKDEFVTFNPVAKFMSSFISLNAGDTVFDPFGGCANLITSIARVNPVKAKYFMNDINENQVYLGTLNLLANGIKEYNYVNIDSLKEINWDIQSEKYFDWIITDPPAGMIPAREKYSDSKYLKFGIGKRFESLLIQLILTKLSPKGKAILTVSEAFCYSEDLVSKKVRKYLVDNDLLELVISLPRFTQFSFSAGRTSILVINKNKPVQRSQKVIFARISDKSNEIFEEIHDLISSNIDDESIYEYKGLHDMITGTEIRLVENDEILQKNHTFNSNTYIFPWDNIIEKLTDKKSLKEIIIKYSSGLSISKEYFVSFVGRSPLYSYITIQDLCDSEDELRLKPHRSQKVVSHSYFDTTGQKYKGIPQKTILIARTGQNLKPSLYDSEEPIIVSNNIIVLHVNEELISPEYLISQMKESYFIDQVQSIRKGVAQSYFNIGDFLDLVVSVPSKHEQEIRLKNYYNELLESAKEKIGIKEEEKKEQEKKILETIHHEYFNRKQPLDGFKDIIDYISSKIKNGNQLNWSDKITTSARLDEWTDNFISTLAYVDEIFNNIPLIFKYDKSLLQKEKIPILEFIKRETDRFRKQFNESNIKCNLSGKNKELYIDEKQFSYAIQNLILNSLKHAFDHDQKYRLIAFEISLSSDKLSLYIDYKDNGKGFPDGFNLNNFIKLYNKSGKKAGSGIGGFLINEIIKNHEGTLLLIEEPELLGSFKTFFRIILPYNEN